MEPLHNFEISVTSLTLAAPRILESYGKTKISLNCYIHTSLWCLIQKVLRRPLRPQKLLWRPLDFQQQFY